MHPAVAKAQHNEDHTADLLENAAQASNQSRDLDHDVLAAVARQHAHARLARRAHHKARVLLALAGLSPDAALLICVLAACTGARWASVPGGGRRPEVEAGGQLGRDAARPGELVRRRLWGTAGAD